MKSLAYLPSVDSERANWLKNLNAKLPFYKTPLELSDSELKQIDNDTQMFTFIVNTCEFMKQTQQNFTAYKNMLNHSTKNQPLGAFPEFPVLGTIPDLVPAGIFDRERALVQRIKNHKNYSDAIGEDLDIISHTPPVDVDNLKPKLKIKLDAGRPHIKCVKGAADALDLFVDHADGNGYVLIGRLLKFDYIDTTPLPANVTLVEYKYKAMYVFGNEKVGLMSNEESIAVKKL